MDSHIRWYELCPPLSADFLTPRAQDAYLLFVIQSTTLPSLYISRSSAYKAIAWNDHARDSIHHWTTEHQEICGSIGPVLLLKLQMRANGFLLLASKATMRYIQTKLTGESSLKEAPPFLPSLYWTAKIISFMEETARKYPISEPPIVTYYDGFTSQLIHLALFIVSAVPFHLWCKIQTRDLWEAAPFQQAGNLDIWMEAAERSPDIMLLNVPEAVWFRLESWPLAHAILKYSNDASAPEVQPFLPFIKSMEKAHSKKEVSSKKRTDNPVSLARTAASPSGARAQLLGTQSCQPSGFLARCNTLYADKLELLGQALE